MSEPGAVATGSGRHLRSPFSLNRLSCFDQDKPLKRIDGRGKRLEEVRHPYHEAVWMLKLVVAQIELELKWLEQIQSETPKRAPAKKRNK